MNRNEGVSLITLIITIVVILILASIAFVGSDDTIGTAQYSKFASEFGSYSTSFTTSTIANMQASLSVLGKSVSKAQVIYCAARGIDVKEYDKILNGVIIPGGYTSSRFQTDIKDATGVTVLLADTATPVYEIKNDVVDGYIGKKFYGDNMGVETHWVTASGTVFTLPGYPRNINGENRMYITSELYYLASDSTINGANFLFAKDLIKIEPIKTGSSINIGDQKAEDAADNV